MRNFNMTVLLVILDILAIRFLPVTVWKFYWMVVSVQQPDVMCFGWFIFAGLVLMCGGILWILNLIIYHSFEDEYRRWRED